MKNSNFLSSVQIWAFPEPPPPIAVEVCEDCIPKGYHLVSIFTAKTKLAIFGILVIVENDFMALIISIWFTAFWSNHYYRPQRSCEGYVFTPVCHSVHRWGLPQCMLRYHPPAPPRAGTPTPQKGGVCCPRNFLIQQKPNGNVVSTSHWIRPVLLLSVDTWNGPYWFIPVQPTPSVSRQRHQRWWWAWPGLKSQNRVRESDSV